MRNLDINFRKNGLVFNFQFNTTNTKTGEMVQNYIIPEDWINSDKKIKDLSDKKVCFDCPHSKQENKTCYVRKGNSEMGLNSKVRAFRKKGLTNIPEYSQEIENTLLERLTGKGLRFGSYGEPILLGENLVRKISEKVDYWTGYTHQWHKEKWAKEFFMASVESNLLHKTAENMGFRTFFVKDADKDYDLKSFVNCPASKEMGKRVECKDCKLCMGLNSKAKSVVINKH